MARKRERGTMVAAALPSGSAIDVAWAGPVKWLDHQARAMGVGVCSLRGLVHALVRSFGAETAGRAGVRTALHRFDNPLWRRPVTTNVGLFVRQRINDELKAVGFEEEERRHLEARYRAGERNLAAWFAPDHWGLLMRGSTVGWVLALLLTRELPQAYRAFLEDPALQSEPDQALVQDLLSGQELDATQWFALLVILDFGAWMGLEDHATLQATALRRPLRGKIAPSPRPI